MLETNDLILRKAVLEDWQNMYRNIWSCPESAKYMAWSVTSSEEDAFARMERTIIFQATHDYHWTIVEKKSGQAIGWAGMELLKPGVWGETGIAIGPNFINRGYGKQILNALTNYARDQLGAIRFSACCNSENTASKRVLLSCEFSYTHSEEVIHHRDQVPYTLDYYAKDL